MTLPLTVLIVIPVGFPDADQMESMDTVSLQAVTLVDGSMAYIQHDSKASFTDGQIMDGQVIQLEDGSAAYVQHLSMPKPGRLYNAVLTLALTRLFGLLTFFGCEPWFAGGDGLQLEDGQAVQLEDGTTAIIQTSKGKKIINA